MIYFAIFSLFIGVAWGWMFYEAVINRKKWCIILWALTLGIMQCDKFYTSEINHGFIKGLLGE